VSCRKRLFLLRLRRNLLLKVDLILLSQQAVSLMMRRLALEALLGPVTMLERVTRQQTPRRRLLRRLLLSTSF
jgi:hypothetical protein